MITKKKSACSLLLLLLIHVLVASTGVINGETINPAALVPSTTKLEYHGGPLLTGPPAVNVYLLWYGSFSPQHKLAVSDFFASFHSATPGSVSAWWRTVEAYRDARRAPVSGTVSLAAQASDPGCSLGKTLRRAHVASLARDAIAKKRLFPLDDDGGLYLVLTAPDVAVERFCMSSCGFHDSVAVSGRKVVFGHVGDPAAQCPGLCAWPYAVPTYGPPGAVPLVAPNGVGVDGMVMNVAAVLAGSATNPFGNGYFQGDALAPLEAATACAGMFGDGAYPGYPGKLMTDPRTRASFNVYGARGRRFLLPAMWDPLSLTCKKRLPVYQYHESELKSLLPRAEGRNIFSKTGATALCFGSGR
ncbi:hypothetical protein H6P81_004059 [Aristolochia fimbriata]|uniref:Uncharacterized protein n=1 Tax=Aristolochia fimbriata TaxID=158543 RepID=A0AAV7FH45_ARIFI|nr:hypothetical protein H6P81_004059 [Aristolochia fimbriata]